MASIVIFAIVVQLFRPDKRQHCSTYTEHERPQLVLSIVIFLDKGGMHSQNETFYALLLSAFSLAKNFKSSLR